MTLDGHTLHDEDGCRFAYHDQPSWLVQLGRA